MDSLIIVAGNENIQRKLRQLADWPAHGFELIAEVSTRDDAVSLIISKSPALTIIDASLPHAALLDIMEITRHRGYLGQFLLVSSKQDFKAAQIALKYDAAGYVLIPTTPAAFASELKEVRRRIDKQKLENELLSFCRHTALQEILRELIIAGKAPPTEALKNLSFEADSYQIAIFELLVSNSAAAFQSFSELIKATGFERISFLSFSPGPCEIILLKGSLSIELMRQLLSEQSPGYQNNAGFFISLGNVVSSLSSVNLSYSQARFACDRKFLTPEKTLSLSYENLTAAKHTALTDTKMHSFRKQFINCLQTFKRHNLLDIIHELGEYMSSTQATCADAKLYLADLFLNVKESLMHLYSTSDIPIASNTEILTFISHKSFLHEVLAFYSQQFELIMSSIGSTSRDSVLDDVFYYIAHNYSQPIKLETLASLFGYNSAYLGKIFHKTAGISFNSYVDKLRVEHSMRLLRDGDMKVYEISRQVGYKSVDYYHKKFRALTGESPAEYRKRTQAEDD